MSKTHKNQHIMNFENTIDNLNKKLNQLDEQYSQLKNLLDTLPGDIYWKDQHGIWRGLNQRCAKSLQRMGFIEKGQEDEVIGKTDYQLFDTETADGYRKNDMEVLEKKIEVAREEATQLSSGEQVVLLSTKKPLLDKMGQIIGIVGNTIDITHLKKIETELKKSKEIAEIANQAKSDFISNMEHDLRTPFTGIRGIASLLYDTETDSEKKSLMELMMQSCKQWETVHNRIFDVLVVEHESPLEIEAVSIHQELLEIQEMMAATIHVKQLIYETHLIATEVDRINTDKLKFRLILSSIISNAIKFTEKGKVRVEVARDPKHCVIKVIDTGIGVPIDKFDYIFEKFTKLSRSNKHASDFQGVGLGLYIAKQYATQLGGTIQIESKLGDGSTFIVKLPI